MSDGRHRPEQIYADHKLGVQRPVGIRTVMDSEEIRKIIEDAYLAGYYFAKNERMETEASDRKEMIR